jgi:signal peptidase I
MTSPADPGAPANSGDPGAPANPGDPGAPANPGDPGAPANPGDPGAPANPGDPGAPANPGDPGAPADAGDPGAPGASASPQRRRTWRRTLVETVALVAVALLLAGLVRTFVFQVFWIPSTSMVPTLDVNDRIVVDKLFFSPSDVHEGDIVVFSHPPLDECGESQQTDLVKRVIGLPGQTIYSQGNTIYINGKPLSEPYLPSHDPLGKPIASKQHPYKVPPGDFYVMGDNRAISCDSRYWGPITGSSIVGKVIAVVWRNNHPYFRWF